MLVEAIGLKQLLTGTLIAVTIALVAIRRRQYQRRMIIAISLFSLGTTLMLASTIFRPDLAFVDLELAALIAWIASTGYFLSMLVRDRGTNTDP
jgi:hypothetical protein